MTEDKARAKSGGKVSKLKQAMTELWAKVVDRHLERVTALEEAAAAILDGSFGDELREDATNHAHNLAGTLGSFGLIEAGEEARKLEQTLREERAMSPEDGATFQEALARIRAAVEAGPLEKEHPGASDDDERPIQERSTDGSRTPLLLIVDDDEALRGLLENEAAERALEAVSAASIKEAREVVRERVPDVAVVDIHFPDEPETGMELLQELSARTPPIPSLILSARDTFTDRVEAARRGARAFMDKPVVPERVLDSVQDLLAVHHGPDTRVLSVDDDPTVHSILRRLLKREGVQLRGVSDPERFWGVLEEVDPDLVILDLNMPEVEGLDLCRVIRNDDRWARLPVVVLTSATDPDTVMRVFEAGADDYLAKPIRIPELVARIQNRVERIKLLRQSGDVDAATGVASRGHFEKILARDLKLGARHQQPVALGMVEMDRLDRIQRSYGHPAGERALRLVAQTLQTSLRPEDMVARWKDDGFAVGMFGMDRERGVERLEAVLEDITEEMHQLPGGHRVRISFSGGVAAFPADGESLEDLATAAEGALSAATERGGARILACGS